jgi:hypothetical protein
MVTERKATELTRTSEKREVVEKCMACYWSFFFLMGLGAISEIGCLVWFGRMRVRMEGCKMRKKNKRSLVPFMVVVLHSNS